MALKARMSAAAIGLACAAMLAVGCGDKKAEGGDPAAKVAAKVKSAAPLGSGGGGGGGESYVPTGELIADSGFRPDVDGFSFPNYGNEEDPQNLTPANVEALFGELVCVSGTGEDCVLTPAGEKWMDTQNEIMDGGHCMGFSVSSLRMFAETLDVAEFGADVPNNLALDGNDALQSNLAESFVYQSIDQIVEDQITGTPAEIVDALVKVINEGKDYYTLGFYKRDGTGGHAMTPLAVEDKGGGKMAILVYDNNYPDVIKAMEIDKNANTYRYNGSTNPDEAESIYEGDETTQPMELIPTLVGENLQPCPFCDDALVEEGAQESLGSVPAKGDRYAEIALVGDNANHPHLVLSDAKDRQTGIIGGKLVEDIPGVEVVQQFADDPSIGGPEPRFRVPVGMDVAITIDGTDLEKTAKGVAVNYTSDGKVIEVEEITMAPGQTDTMFVTAKDYVVAYETNNKNGDAPEFYAGVDEEDASYTLAAAPVDDIKPGSLLGLAILQKEGQVLFDLSDATTISGDTAKVIMAISKLDESGKEQLWLDDDLEIDTDLKEDAYLNYEAQDLVPGKSINIEVGPEDGPFRNSKAEFDGG